MIRKRRMHANYYTIKLKNEFELNLHCRFDADSVRHVVDIYFDPDIFLHGESYRIPHETAVYLADQQRARYSA